MASGTSGVIMNFRKWRAVARPNESCAPSARTMRSPSACLPSVAPRGELVISAS